MNTGVTPKVQFLVYHGLFRRLCLFVWFELFGLGCLGFGAVEFVLGLAFPLALSVVGTDRPVEVLVEAVEVSLAVFEGRLGLIEVERLREVPTLPQTALDLLAVVLDRFEGSFGRSRAEERID